MRKVNLNNLPHYIGKNISWKDSVGELVEFEYDGIVGKIEILDYDINTRNLTVKYNDLITTVKYNGFSKAQLSKCLGLTTPPFQYTYEIGDIIKTKTGKIKITDKIIIERGLGGHRAKGYTYSCRLCESCGEIEEAHLRNGVGCPVCSNKKIVKGINDMWTTHPEQAKLLANPSDGYRYSFCSGQKVDVICENCNKTIKDVMISKLNSGEYSCPYCSDGISYPEKFIANLLVQLGVKFKYQKRFDWAQGKRYDFYLLDYNAIVEVHGRQHYDEDYQFFDTLLKEQQEIDKLKHDLAEKHNINKYITIDARYSKLDYIKYSVINSDLSSMFDLSKINWGKCDKNAVKSKIKEVCDLWKEIHNIKKIMSMVNISSPTTIRKYLKKGTEYGFCNYNAKEEAEKSWFTKENNRWTK